MLSWVVTPLWLAAGDNRRGRVRVVPGGGRSTPSGTENLSPHAQVVPGRKMVHPDAQNVPVE